MPNDILAQKELKELLHYDPDTGVFTWVASPSTIVKIGDITGCPDSRGYLVIGIKGKIYKSHRLAWLYMMGEWPTGEIDHINHIKNDNRWINLREVTHKENGRNQALSKNSTSGACGVHWVKRDEKWRTRIKVNGENLHLGCFFDKFEAICARKSAENKYGFHPNHGD